MIDTNRPIAVTGATGLLGGRLVRHLLARGATVLAGVRDVTGSRPALQGATLFHCDLPGHIDRHVLKDAAVCVHCAYTTRFTNLNDARRTNELGTQALFDACRDAGVERFIFISSTSAHEDAKSYYGRSKLKLESLMDPLRDLIIRSGLLLDTRTGLFARMVDAMKRRRVIPLFGGGRQPVQTIHIDDCCAGILAAIEQHRMGRIVLAEPEGWTMRELLKQVAARLHKRVHFIPVPIGPTLLSLRIAERMGLSLAFTSENLLGLQSMRHQPCADDLSSLGIKVRSMPQSLDALFAEQKNA